MKKLIIHSALLVVCFTIVGCASIVDGRPKTVHINSNPPGAKLSIYNRDGETVSVQTTPAVVKLHRGHGYFSAEKYKLVFDAPGYNHDEMFLQGTINPIYFGNIVLGGAIGFFFVDPATGAMWTFPGTVNRNLVSSTATATPEDLKSAELKPVKP